MELISATPKMVYEKTGSHQGCPAVFIEYELKCKQCSDGLVQATTINRPISREQDVEMVDAQIKHALSMLIKVMRKCGACGSYSGLSDADEQKLITMLNVVDATWLKDNIVGLGTYKPFHVVHAEAAAKGRERATATRSLGSSTKNENQTSSVNTLQVEQDFQEALSG